MNKQTNSEATMRDALKMAIEAMQTCDLETGTWSAVDIALAIHACKEALEQPADYLYVYKGSEIWIKDSLDIPSAGFLIGKIRLEK